MKVHYYVWAGGIFSLFMQGILQNHEKIKGDNFYFEASMKDQLLVPSYLKGVRLERSDVLKYNLCNPFDFIFNQSKDDISERIELAPIKSFFGKHRPLSNNPALLKEYHKLYKSLSWKQELLDEFQEIDNLVNNEKSYLGIHFRLTTMNCYTKLVPIEDFFSLIDAHIKNYNGIILTSDNIESIDKFYKNYGKENVICMDMETRFKTEAGDTYKYHVEEFSQFFTKEYWFNGLKEAYLLSKANTVIKRASNLNNMAVVMRGKPQMEIFANGSL